MWPDGTRAPFATRVPGLGANAVDTESDQASWLAIGAWLTGYALGDVPAASGLDDALESFCQGACPQAPRHKMVDFAGAVDREAAGGAGLPFLLDPMAPGTRRSVLRSSHEHGDRTRRKSRGVFDTPADVVTFTASYEAGRLDSSPINVLDPAVGSGVSRRDPPALGVDRTVNTYGIDTNARSRRLRAPFRAVCHVWLARTAVAVG